VFHVEHDFVTAWQRFQQILKQRNAALRMKQSRSLVSAWDVDLIRLAEVIHRSRSSYVERLAVEAARLVSILLRGELTLGYRSGWARELSFEEALIKSWSQDHEVGTTSVGPQRAEILFKLNGESVKGRVSRGQQKLLAAALLLAQLNLIPRDGCQPTLLLDDPAAELDSDRLLGLIGEIRGQALQLVVTSLSDQFSGFGIPGRHYRVHEGVVREA
jgi:DNA replication and repair protein RecF